MKKDSVSLSLDKSIHVRGYEIKRLPLGAYLRAAQTLRDTPMRLVSACFPNQDVTQALASLKTIDKAGATDLAMRALLSVPEEAAALLSELTGVPLDSLLSDPDIGLDGAAEMVQAFFDVNGIENFTRAVRNLTEQIKAAKATTNGSNG